MKKTLARSLAAALLLSLALALGSCAGGCFAMDATGLLDAAPALITRAATFNEIYYGAGIPFDETVTDYGSYYPADPAYLAAAGFSTVAELREATAEVFSEDYTTLIAETSLGGFAAEGTTGYVYARYASSQAENLRDENETILVYGKSSYLDYPIGTSAYDFTTMKITRRTRDYVAVTLSVTTVTRDLPPEGEEPPATPTYTTKTADMEIRFVKETAGWRIDSATY